MSNLFIATQLRYLKKVCELHKRVKDINASLATLHPIAVVNDGNFFVFDYNH
ncbi:MAG: hypothetical protein FWF77_09075 [Defluviitaleaceae bacterium]|nr:hypothetical protein [Defluviitaleaceae bacterium]